MPANAMFRIWRGDASGGAFQDYKTQVDEGMVVLDAIHRIQADQAVNRHRNSQSRDRT